MKNKTESGMFLLPPKKGTCQQCATEHEEWEPHNLCLYYHYHFYSQHGYFPTWIDAMAHCTEKIKKSTIDVLNEQGISLNAKVE